MGEREREEEREREREREGASLCKWVSVDHYSDGRGCMPSPTLILQTDITQTIERTVLSR